MELPLHAGSVDRPPTGARWLAVARGAALLTMGIGVGVIAGLPLAQHDPLVPILVAVCAGTAGAVIAFRKPHSLIALGIADVLLALAVGSTAFGRLGILYIPSLLAFLAVTARLDRSPAAASGATERSEAEDVFKTEAQVGEPAEAVEAEVPTAEPNDAATPVETAEAVEAGEPEGEPVEELEDGWGFLAELSDLEAETPATEPVDPDPVNSENHVPVRVVVDIAAFERATDPPEGGRHRAPSTPGRVTRAPRRAAAAARSAGHTVGRAAKAGLRLVRTELTEEPKVPEPPIAELKTEDPEPLWRSLADR
jgi:hypothetical protein